METRCPSRGRCPSRCCRSLANHSWPRHRRLARRCRCVGSEGTGGETESLDKFQVPSSRFQVENQEPVSLQLGTWNLEPGTNERYPALITRILMSTPGGRLSPLFSAS